MTIAAEACRKLTPIDPVETGVLPRLPELPDIEAVAFDIYGTLLISAAGDISLANKTVSAEIVLPSMSTRSSPNIRAASFCSSFARFLFGNRGIRGTTMLGLSD